MRQGIIQLACHWNTRYVRQTLRCWPSVYHESFHMFLSLLFMCHQMQTWRMQQIWSAATCMTLKRQPIMHSKSLLEILIIGHSKPQPWTIFNSWNVLHGKIVNLTSVTQMCKMPTPLWLYLHPEDLTITWSNLSADIGPWCRGNRLLLALSKSGLLMLFRTLKNL